MLRVTGILLAAGSSSRFGSNKMLAPMADGTPLAIVAASKLIAAVPECFAVLRPGDDELANLLAKEGLRIVECAEAESGMGHSLEAGVAAASTADAWLIALADMPYIQYSTYRRLALALGGGVTLVAPVCEGRRGHPVGFGASYRNALQNCQGDHGARALLARDAAHMAYIRVDDPGVLTDVDTRSDLDRPYQTMPIPRSAPTEDGS